MTPTYILYSGKNQGWLSVSGNYGSDLEQARHFSRDEALAMVKRHRDQAGYQLIPVMLDDLGAA